MKKLKLNEYSTLANAEMLEVKGGYGGGGAPLCADTAPTCNGLCAPIWNGSNMVSTTCTKHTWNFTTYCSCD